MRRVRLVDLGRILEFCKCMNTTGTQQGKRVGFSCMLARWEHENGTDNNPSSTITIKDHGESYYHCWSCNTKGSLYDVVMKIRGKVKDTPLKTQYNFNRALELLADEEEDAELYIPDYEDVQMNSSAITSVWSEDFINSFLPISKSAIGRKYVTGRGVPPKLAVQMGLVFDTTENRVCFPIRDFEGMLVGLRGRALDTTNPLRYKAYKYYGTMNNHVWLGEHDIDMDSPVVLTESVFDYASIKRVYPNVLASLTSGISKDQFTRIAGAVDIVTLYDNDKGGNNARELIDSALSAYPLQHLVPVEEGADAGDMSAEEVKEALELAGI